MKPNAGGESTRLSEGRDENAASTRGASGNNSSKLAGGPQLKKKGRGKLTKHKGTGKITGPGQKFVPRDQ